MVALLSSKIADASASAAPAATTNPLLRLLDEAGRIAGREAGQDRPAAAMMVANFRGNGRCGDLGTQGDETSIGCGQDLRINVLRLHGQETYIRKSDSLVLQFLPLYATAHQEEEETRLGGQPRAASITTSSP